MTWSIYRRNAGLARLGLLDFSTASLTLRWSRPSTALIRTATVDAVDVGRGDGLIIVRDGQTVMSGIVAGKSRTVTAGSDVVDLTVVDEVARLAGRLVYPDPTVAADGTQTARDVRTGPAGDVILQYIDVNAGPSALADRRIPGLVVAAGTGVGGTVTGRGRWRQLVEFCAVLADRGDVGFQAVQPVGSSTIDVDVVVPTDRYEARFDIDGGSGTGSIAAWSYRTSLPSTTVGIAGGRGELAGRLIRVAAQDVATFGWWETWLDRNNDGDEDDLQSQLDALDDSLADALRDGGSRETLEVSPVDSPALRWRTHYELGDRVRVRIDGVWMWRQVRGLEVTVDVDGEQVRPVLGDAASDQVLRLLRRIGAVEQQVDERGRN